VKSPPSASQVPTISPAPDEQSERTTRPSVAPNSWPLGSATARNSSAGCSAVATRVAILRKSVVGAEQLVCVVALALDHRQRAIVFLDLPDRGSIRGDHAGLVAARPNGCFEVQPAPVVVAQPCFEHSRR
jgi:hypothetical protein